jgi:uncharacterized membrane protein YcaP (DUF421 family)
MNSEPAFFFAGWAPILRVLLVGTCAYLFLLFTLRAAGPRAIAKTNIFDFIILVGIGSAFGRILTAKDVAVVEACVAFTLLASLHYGASWLRLRSKRLASLLDADPALLFYKGKYLGAALRQARVTEADIEAAVRAKGLGSMNEVEAVVLEADGELSIIRQGPAAQELVSRLVK